MTDGMTKEESARLATTEATLNAHLKTCIEHHTENNKAHSALFRQIWLLMTGVVVGMLIVIRMLWVLGEKLV